MEKPIKGFIIMMWLVAALAATNIWAQESEDSRLGVSAGLKYMSDYIWRGKYWYGGDGAFFSSLSYAVFDTGLFLGVCSELSEDWIFDGTDTVKDIHATDFSADYSHSFGKTVTIGAGLWYFLMRENDYSFLSGYMSATFDSLPLSPKIMYTHDYYTTLEEGSDFYLQLGASKSFELVKDSCLDLGAIAGYYYADSTDQEGISDIDFSVGISMAKGIVNYIAGFHYVIVPSKDFYKDMDGKKDINRFYATCAVYCSI